ncbi:hypothetical protein [Fimbriiglobus ruber]|uniref:hypothetical protein n=1 Tax=Fimbriiglobus ruber TaxID=1908690 RepID=UPI000B4A662F|nr:hypothetical protein [Fimbriiglobus ruber]
MNEQRITYLYLYSHTSIDGNRRCKVGISVNHKNRAFGHYAVGPLSFVAQFAMPTRAEAFALETRVCRAFPAFLKRELLDATPEAVRRFIEANIQKARVS